MKQRVCGILSIGPVVMENSWYREKRWAPGPVVVVGVGVGVARCEGEKRTVERRKEMERRKDGELWMILPDMTRQLEE
jgi:hypothetical protein